MSDVTVVSWAKRKALLAK